ncbi:MAG TPA: TerC family protein [Planctomycetes bacterium]|nr:TerC family protein [Planctomycetota bacterium]
MDWLTSPDAWIALLTLTLLEIVLGVDNLVFLSILSGRLPAERQASARRIGLGLALVGRIALLSCVAWLMRLESPLFHAFGRDISTRDLILLAGGLFLLFKATHEIHGNMEGDGEEAPRSTNPPSFSSVLLQILVLDLVFSLDSVITAVGMADDLGVMIVAVVLAVVFMMWTADAVADFIERHPTVKMLALSFLLLVGTALIADGLSFHIPRGYIYFAMAFSVFVEVLNLRSGARRRTP